VESKDYRTDGKRLQTRVSVALESCLMNSGFGERRGVDYWCLTRVAKKKKVIGIRRSPGREDRRKDLPEGILTSLITLTSS
jgi:hypothetical protein